MEADSMVIGMGGQGIQSIDNFHKPKDLGCCLASMAFRLLSSFSAVPVQARVAYLRM